MVSIGSLTRRELRIKASECMIITVAMLTESSDTQALVGIHDMDDVAVDPEQEMASSIVLYFLHDSYENSKTNKNENDDDRIIIITIIISISIISIIIIIVIVIIIITIINIIIIIIVVVVVVVL